MNNEEVERIEEAVRYEEERLASRREAVQERTADLERVRQQRDAVLLEAADDAASDAAGELERLTDKERDAERAVRDAEKVAEATAARLEQLRADLDGARRAAEEAKLVPGYHARLDVAERADRLADELVELLRELLTMSEERQATQRRAGHKPEPDMRPRIADSVIWRVADAVLPPGQRPPTLDQWHAPLARLLSDAPPQSRSAQRARADQFNERRVAREAEERERERELELNRDRGRLKEWRRVGFNGPQRYALEAKLAAIDRPQEAQVVEQHEGPGYGWDLVTR